MNTTLLAVSPMSCCQVARSNVTDCAAASEPSAAHSPSRSDVVSAPCVTPKSTRRPRTASRFTCEAIGTSSPPPNSRGSSSRVYCSGNPTSGSASTEPACQNTPASAADARAKYETALPSRSSMACSAPAGMPSGTSAPRTPGPTR